jgi:predicted Zn-dependent protease
MVAVKSLLLLCLLLPLAAMAQPAPLPAGAQPPQDTAAAATAASAKPSGIAPALAAAEDKIDAHAYDDARSLLAAYLAQHPGDARALFDLGFAEDSVGNQQDAERDYGRAIAADPQQFEAHAALGLLLAQTGQDDRARSELQSASTLEPATHDDAAKAQVWRSLAQLQVAKDPAAAKQSLLKALALTPAQQSPADLVLTGQIAEASDDPETAATAYHRALAADPGSAGATSGLVHLLLKEKKPQEAEPLLRAALAKHPEDAGLTAQLASALSAQGKDAEALATLEHLHQLRPEDPAVTRMLADAELQHGAADKAAPLLESALQATPKDSELLTDYGQSLIYTRQFAAAIPVLERAVAADPHDEEAWGGLAFAHARLHQPQEALKALAARQQIAPDNAETLFLWATSYDNLSQKKQAADYYERFLAAAHGKFPDEEWQAKHRLVALKAR